jgi:hypothetical protein
MPILGYLQYKVIRCIIEQLLIKQDPAHPEKAPFVGLRKFFREKNTFLPYEEAYCWKDVYNPKTGWDDIQKYVKVSDKDANGQPNFSTRYWNSVVEDRNIQARQISAIIMTAPILLSFFSFFKHSTVNRFLHPTEDIWYLKYFSLCGINIPGLMLYRLGEKYFFGYRANLKRLLDHYDRNKIPTSLQSLFDKLALCHQAGLLTKQFEKPITKPGLFARLKAKFQKSAKNKNEPVPTAKTTAATETKAIPEAAPQGGVSTKTQKLGIFARIKAKFQKRAKDKKEPVPETKPKTKATPEIKIDLDIITLMILLHIEEHLLEYSTYNISRFRANRYNNITGGRTPTAYLKIIEDQLTKTLEPYDVQS